MYSAFAEVYDKLMADAEYEERSQYLLDIFVRFGKIPSLLLDAACGTGTLTCILAQSGVKEIVAVDASEEMLSIAADKAEKAHVDVIFLCQKLSELDLYGTVDGAICTLDSINHITSKKELQKSLDKISLFLEQNSIFIFDVNTVYKHESILGNNCFVSEEDGTFCSWQCSYNKTTRIVDIDLDFFIKDNDRYIRHSDYVCERAYTDEELKIMLKKAGFKLIAIYADMKFTRPGPKCDRKVFVVKKV